MKTVSCAAAKAARTHARQARRPRSHAAAPNIQQKAQSAMTIPRFFADATRNSTHRTAPLYLQKARRKGRNHQAWLPNGPFHTAKRHVLQRKTSRFGARNRLSCNPLRTKPLQEAGKTMKRHYTDPKAKQPLTDKKQAEKARSFLAFSAKKLVTLQHQ